MCDVRCIIYSYDLQFLEEVVASYDAMIMIPLVLYV